MILTNTRPVKNYRACSRQATTATLLNWAKLEEKRRLSYGRWGGRPPQRH
jgi:hypothetical protein